MVLSGSLVAAGGTNGAAQRPRWVSDWTPSHAVDVIDGIPVYDCSSSQPGGDGESAAPAFGPAHVAEIADPERGALSMVGPGVAVVRGVFGKEVMREFDAFVNEYLQDPANQSLKKDHFSSVNKRIWRVPEKLVTYEGREKTAAELDTADRRGANPHILFALLTSPALNGVLDRFLGRYHIGSLAVNQVVPDGPAQALHTDYPPGFFTKRNAQDADGTVDGDSALLDFLTPHQLEHVFPFFSLQVGIAVTRITAENGATQLVPFSHRIEGADLSVMPDNVDQCEAGGAPSSTPSAFSRELEPFMVHSPELQPGDCLFFNRKVLHRGGANQTDAARTALLLQAVMPFGAKMERLDGEMTWMKLREWMDKEEEEAVGGAVKEMSAMERSKLKFRLCGASFPRDMDEADRSEKNA